MSRVHRYSYNGHGSVNDLITSVWPLHRKGRSVNRQISPIKGPGRLNPPAPNCGDVELPNGLVVQREQKFAVISPII